MTLNRKLKAEPDRFDCTLTREEVMAAREADNGPSTPRPLLRPAERAWKGKS